MAEARRACWRMSSTWRFVETSAARSRSRSATPRMAVRGLFNSWAAPVNIWPIAANFSFCASCCSASFQSVTLRNEATTLAIFPDSSKRG